MQRGLLTGRELIAELRFRRVGNWKVDAVRQWTRQSPSCPIAKRAEADYLPHLFDLRSVLVWLAERGEQQQHSAGSQTRAVGIAARRALAEIDAIAPLRLFVLARLCLRRWRSRLMRLVMARGRR